MIRITNLILANSTSNPTSTHVFSRIRNKKKLKTITFQIRILGSLTWLAFSVFLPLEGGPVTAYSTADYRTSFLGTPRPSREYAPFFIYFNISFINTLGIFYLDQNRIKYFFFQLQQKHENGARLSFIINPNEEQAKK